MEKQLKDKEFDILHILVHSQSPMTAAEIVKANQGLTVNMVQAILRKLMDMDLVEVADIVYSGNVLARAFKATEDASDIVQNLFNQMISQYRKIVPLDSLLRSMLHVDMEPAERETVTSCLKTECRLS